MKRSLQTIILSVGFSVVPLIIHAQSGPAAGGHGSSFAQSSPEPWTLDVGTRLPRRADATLRANRLKAAGKSHTSTPVDVIGASKSPEVVLPWELHRVSL